MLPNKENSKFLKLVKELPNFDFGEGLLLDVIGQQHGHGTLPQLQAIIDQKLLSREDACRQWGNSIGIAYVDVLASTITEEAIDKIPQEIARKVRAIGLYVIDDILTVAMATPEDATLVRRLQQISQLTISPVFSLPC